MFCYVGCIAYIFMIYSRKQSSFFALRLFCFHTLSLVLLPHVCLAVFLLNIFKVFTNARLP